MTSDKRVIQGNPKRTRAYIGLGSNEGDRVSCIQQAMQFIKDVPGISVAESSSLYESEPLGSNSQKWFVNAVAAIIDTKLSVEELLDVCKDIEKRMQSLHSLQEEKSASSFNGHIIDLDILFFGNHILETNQLRVPHPRSFNERTLWYHFWKLLRFYPSAPQ